jgi:hypothetical protein
MTIERRGQRVRLNIGTEVGHLADLNRIGPA